MPPVSEDKQWKRHGWGSGRRRSFAMKSQVNKEQTNKKLRGNKLLERRQYMALKDEPVQLKEAREDVGGFEDYGKTCWEKNQKYPCPEPEQLWEASEITVVWPWPWDKVYSKVTEIRTQGKDCGAVNMAWSDKSICLNVFSALSQLRHHYPWPGANLISVLEPHHHTTMSKVMSNEHSSLLPL